MDVVILTNHKISSSPRRMMSSHVSEFHCLTNTTASLLILCAYFIVYVVVPGTAFCDDASVRRKNKNATSLISTMTYLVRRSTIHARVHHVLQCDFDVLYCMYVHTRIHSSTLLCCGRLGVSSYVRRAHCSTVVPSDFDLPGTSTYVQFLFAFV